MPREERLELRQIRVARDLLGEDADGVLEELDSFPGLAEAEEQ
jgi:hypothetical protein